MQVDVDMKTNYLTLRVSSKELQDAAGTPYTDVKTVDELIVHLIAFRADNPFVSLPVLKDDRSPVVRPFWVDGDEGSPRHVAI